MLIDYLDAGHDWRSAYKLIIGCVVPRPIALVSTRNMQGQLNLAPFSFFNMCSANPPVLMFAAALNRRCEMKHTHRNVIATRDFVVAIVDEPIAPRMVRAAAELPYGESEFAFAGLSTAPSTHVSAACVREAPVNIECRLREVVSMGERPGSGQVIFGDIVALHIRDELLSSDRTSIDASRFAAVGRLGGESYSTVRDSWTATIPEVGA